MPQPPDNEIPINVPISGVLNRTPEVVIALTARVVGVAVVLALVVTGCGATEATDRSDRISTTTAAKAVFPTEPMSDEQFYERSCAYIRDTAPRYDVHAGMGDEPFHRFLAMSRLLVGYDDLAPHRQAIFELALRDYIHMDERDPAIAPELPDRC